MAETGSRSAPPAVAKGWTDAVTKRCFFIGLAKLHGGTPVPLSADADPVARDDDVVGPGRQAAAEVDLQRVVLVQRDDQASAPSAVGSL